MTNPRSPRPRTPQPGAHPGADLDALRGAVADRRAAPRPDRTSRLHRTSRALIAVAVLGVLAPGAAHAATDHEDHDDTEGAADSRAHVTIDAGNDGLTGPAEVAGGLVDVTITTEDDDVGHSVYIARLAEGATMDDVAAGGPEALATLLTFVGGVGTIHDGATIDLTVDLEPGNYVAIDNVFLPEPTGVLPFVVGEPEADEAPEPESEGTVQLGPGMLIAAPDGFDGGGTWHFANVDDALTHEALLVRLGDGIGVPEVVEWAHAGRPEPAPFEAELAGVGPLAPGAQAWLTLPELPAGDYALVCYVPFDDGSSHLASGMIAPFTVS